MVPLSYLKENTSHPVFSTLLSLLSSASSRTITKQPCLACLLPLCVCVFFYPQTKTTCCPTIKQNSVRNRLVCAAKATPVRTTTTAKTGGAARTNTNTGAPSQRVKGIVFNNLIMDVLKKIVACFLFFLFFCRCRALPCPAVKQSEEWGDPSKCEGAEGCQYCHTRTEQQFHPEVCLIQLKQSAP